MKMTNHQMKLLTEVALDTVKSTFNAAQSAVLSSKEYKDAAKKLDSHTYVVAMKEVIKLAPKVNAAAEVADREKSSAEHWIRTNTDNYIYLKSNISSISVSNTKNDIEKFKEGALQVEFGSKLQSWKNIKCDAEKAIEKKLVVAQFSDVDMDKLLATIGEEVAKAIIK